MEKCCLWNECNGQTLFEVKMELIGKLASNYNTKIGMFPSASKYVSVKFAYQCLHILNNKEGLNGIKGITQIKNRESLFKYQSRIYNAQRNSGVNHWGTKMRWNNNIFHRYMLLRAKYCHFDAREF